MALEWPLNTGFTVRAKLILILTKCFGEIQAMKVNCSAKLTSFYELPQMFPSGNIYNNSSTLDAEQFAFPPWSQFFVQN